MFSWRLGLTKPFPSFRPFGCCRCSTDMGSMLLASLCMFQSFDLHHGHHLHHLCGSYRLDPHALKQNDCEDGLLFKALEGGDCWHARPVSLSHPLNIYHHNLSTLDQLYTHHGLPISYLHTPDKYLTHWFLSLIWDRYTARDFLQLCILISINRCLLAVGKHLLQGVSIHYHV